MKIILTLPCFDYMTPVCHFEGKSGRTYPFVWSRVCGTHVYEHDSKKGGMEKFLLGAEELNRVVEDIYFSPHLGPSFPIIPVAIEDLDEVEKENLKLSNETKPKIRRRKHSLVEK